MTDLFEREGSIRKRLAEVEGFEGVGRGVIGLLPLWKCVEKCEKESGPGSSETDFPSNRVNALIYRAISGR